MTAFSGSSGSSSPVAVPTKFSYGPTVPNDIPAKADVVDVTTIWVIRASATATRPANEAASKLAMTLARRAMWQVRNPTICDPPVGYTDNAAPDFALVADGAGLGGADVGVHVLLDQEAIVAEGVGGRGHCVDVRLVCRVAFLDRRPWIVGRQPVGQGRGEVDLQPARVAAIGM